MDTIFEWDRRKEQENITKHGYSFMEAREIFRDPKIIHLEDIKHSDRENRFYAVGKTKRGIVLTVRYTRQGNTIRVFGAASWRKWRKFYEKNTQPS